LRGAVSLPEQAGDRTLLFFEPSSIMGFVKFEVQTKNQQFPEEIFFLRLLKNAQMQGPRRPEE
jgi:hypothetical protein